MARIQLCSLRDALSPLRIACTVIAGDLKRCAPGEGRLDLSDGSLPLDVSIESAVVGTTLLEDNEVVVSRHSRVQTRGGTPQLASRVDRALVNVRAEYIVPVLPRDAGPAPRRRRIRSSNS